MRTGFFERLLKLIGSAITAFLAFFIIYLTFRNDDRAIESPALLAILNGIFLTSVSFFTAVISAVGYVRSGLWRFLSLSAGSIVLGSTALLAGTLMSTFSVNVPITIYNIGSLLAAVCFSVTVFRFGTISITKKYPAKRIFISFITLILSFSVIAIIVIFSVKHIFPPFFIQGIGSTPIREVVLGLAIVLVGITAINVFRDYVETKTSFNFWYSLGLFCIAMGFCGVYIMNTPGNLLNWIARFAQYIGNVYILFAVIVILYKVNSRSSSFDEILAALFQDPELNYRLIMDIDPNGVVVLNHQGRVLGWNRKAEYLFGYTISEMIGTSLSDIIFQTNKESLEQLIKSMQEQPPDQKISVTTELTAKCKDGSTLPVSFSIAGTKTGYGWMGVATLNDLSLRNKTEEQLIYQSNLLSNVHDALIATDQNDAISYWNKAAEKMFGWTSREVIGINIKNILFSDNVFTEDKNIVLKTAQKKDNIEGEFVYRRKDGNPVVVEASITIFRESDGKFKGSMTAYRDITIRKQALEALGESEEKYRNIVETTSEGIMIADLSGVITYANPRMAQILGYTVDELVGMSGIDLIDPADMSSAYERMEKRINGITDEYDIKFNHKNGGELWLHASGTPIYDAKGSHVGNLAMYTDITNRIMMEVELKQYTAWLKAANEELESFAYSVSHDLRTPLRTLDGFSEMVIMEYGDKLDDTGKNYLNRIRKASQAMSQLTEDILKLSRVSRAEMQKEKINLSDLFLQVADDLKQKQPMRKIDFIIAPDMVDYGDKSLLKILIQNLMENSWKYSGENSDTIIEAGHIQENGMTVYFLRDNGIGFDMNFYHKLFEPFQRLHTDKQYSGNGIGLATAERIINRHEGRIWAESEIGKGTTFYFTLGKFEDKNHE